MKQTQERARIERDKQLAKKDNAVKKEERQKLKEKEKTKAKQKEKIKALSFNPDEDEEECDDFDDEECDNKASKRKEDNDSDESPVKKKRFGMNPNVDTSFLPDRDRDEQENVMRENLRHGCIFF